ncbi:MAG TPA: Amuc_1098 family type IV pilus outer membrane protein, partial [Luteolibacter sp.]|nr:Amuc_1098 family type IV pilus outer membrane protein [Luteolibacter sp.]
MSCFLALTPLQAQQGKIDQEQAKRQAVLEEARELLSRGKQAQQAGQHDQALEAYSGAYGMLGPAPAMAALKAEATEGFVQSAVAETHRLAQAGDLAGARKTIDRVVSANVAPGHPAVAKCLEHLNDPVRNNPAQTAQHTDNIRKVVELIYRADGATALGEYDEATGCYQDILRIDPYNELARRGLTQLNRLRQEASIAGYDRARAEMLGEVDASWQTETKPLADEIDALVLNNKPVENVGIVTVERKLREIIIPKVSMDNVTLAEAVEYLRLVCASQDLISTDQASRGVNFVINLGVEGDPAAAAVLAKRFSLQLTSVPALQVLKYINDQTGTTHVIDDFSVTIRQRGTVEGELILRDYRVPPDFISVLSEDSAQQQEADPFAQTPSSRTGLLTKRLSVQELLKRKGIAFPSGATASYSASGNLLRVLNTPFNQDVIEQLIESLKKVEPVVIAVHVTMIKTQEVDLKELGFDWLLTPFDMGQGAFLGGGTRGNSGGRTAADFSDPFPLPLDPSTVVNPGVITNGLRSGDLSFSTNTLDDLILNPNRETQTRRVAPGILSLTGLFTDGQAQVIMRGLGQAKGVDMMARPSILTRTGEAAKITLAREFIYPTEYDPPEPPQQGQGGGGVNGGFPIAVPGNPTAFEMREVGVNLEVLAVADEAKRYVNLTLNPSIVEFEGFVNFGSPINSAVLDEDGVTVPVELSRNEILMPVFSTRRTSSQLSIADGATIVYGGLLANSIQSIEDKVPVLGDVPLLGRLFRTESKRNISTAVIFMVKVELMDPTGRRYRDL